MKNIELLVKGMKVKLQDHDDRYMCINEDGKIVKRYVDNKCNDFVYTTLRAEWLMDEGEEFKEPPKKKYLISLKRKILAIKDDSIKDVLKGEEIRCAHIANCCEFKCVECPISCKQERKTINDEEVKLHIVEY